MANKKKLLQAAAGTAAAAGGGVTRTSEFFDIALWSGNNYITDVQNFLDLQTDGGLVITKNISDTGGTSNERWHFWDTERGNYKWHNIPGGSSGTDTNGVSFNTDGFRVNNTNKVNQSGTGIQAFKGFCFKNAPGLFKVYSWTGDGSSNRTVSHNLGGDVGFTMIYHGSGGGTRAWWRTRPYNYGFNPLTNAAGSTSYASFSALPTSTTFTLDSWANSNGVQYTAYIWAHDPDNFISCNFFAGNQSASGPSINLGWRPRFLLFKERTTSSNWKIYDSRTDSMSHLITGSASDTHNLTLNESYAESQGLTIKVHAEGFDILDSNNQINGPAVFYVAIRDDTMISDNISSPNNIWYIDGYQGNSNSPAAKYRATYGMGGHGMDAGIIQTRGEIGSGGSGTNANLLLHPANGHALRAGTASGETARVVYSSGTAMENKTNLQAFWDWVETGGQSNKGFGIQKYQGGVSTSYQGDTTTAHTIHLLKRADSFLDVLVYKGDGSAGHEVPHQLGTVPKMIWTNRFDEENTARNILCYHESHGNTGVHYLNANSSATSGQTMWNSTDPSETHFTLGSTANVNQSGRYYEAWLWGEGDYSKYGTFTGNGSSQSITLPWPAKVVMIGGVGHTTSTFWFDTQIGSGSTSKYLKLNSTTTSTAALSQGSSFMNFGNSSSFTVTYRSGGYGHDDQINDNGYTYWYYAIRKQ